MTSFWRHHQGLFDLEKVNKTSIHTSFATRDILYFHELHDTPWLWGWRQIKYPSMHLSQQGISFMVMNYITPYHESEHVMLKELSINCRSHKWDENIIENKFDILKKVFCDQHERPRCTWFLSQICQNVIVIFITWSYNVINLYDMENIHVTL